MLTVCLMSGILANEARNNSKDLLFSLYGTVVIFATERRPNIDVFESYEAWCYRKTCVCHRQKL